MTRKTVCENGAKVAAGALAGWALREHPDWVERLCNAKNERVRKKYADRIMREYRAEEQADTQDLQYRAQQAAAKDALLTAVCLVRADMPGRAVYNWLDGEGTLRTFWLYPTDALNTRLRELVHQ